MLNQLQNTKQLNVSFSFDHSFIFAPVDPESHLGSLRSFVFEVTGHSCLNLAEGRLPISKHCPLGVSRDQSSGKLSDVSIAKQLENLTEKKNKMRNCFWVKIQRLIIEAQVSQKSVAKLSLILLDQDFIRRVQMRSQWNDSSGHGSKIVVVKWDMVLNVSHGEAKL